MRLCYMGSFQLLKGVKRIFFSFLMWLISEYDFGVDVSVKPMLVHVCLVKQQE